MNTRCPNFEDIKHNLDPEYAYIIFETPISSSADEDIEDILPGFSHIQKYVIDRGIYRDNERGVILFLLKLKSDIEDDLCQDICHKKLPVNTTFYFYDSQSKKKL